MKKITIITDSCSDLNNELRNNYDIEYLEMRVLYDGKDMPASLDWEYMPAKEFYDAMRNGTRFKTAQVNMEVYLEKFEEEIKKGNDVLSISCSSALSSSYYGSIRACEELKEKYPDAKIYCVDSRNSSLGLGLMCIDASIMRSEGKTIEEIVEYLEKHKQEVNQVATVEDLNYLKRAGRVTAASAVFGSILKIKPIIISDTLGQNVAIKKVRGRLTSLKTIVEMFVENYTNEDKKMIGISHADCLDDALELKNMIIEAVPAAKDIEFLIEYIGPIVGASVGPGTVSVYFYGKEVTFCSTEK